MPDREPDIEKPLAEEPLIEADTKLLNHGHKDTLAQKRVQKYVERLANTLPNKKDFIAVWYMPNSMLEAHYCNFFYQQDLHPTISGGYVDSAEVYWVTGGDSFIPSTIAFTEDGRLYLLDISEDGTSAIIKDTFNNFEDAFGSGATFYTLLKTDKPPIKSSHLVIKNMDKWIMFAEGEKIYITGLDGTDCTAYVESGRSSNNANAIDIRGKKFKRNPAYDFNIDHDWIFNKVTDSSNTPYLEEGICLEAYSLDEEIEGIFPTYAHSVMYRPTVYMNGSECIVLTNFTRVSRGVDNCDVFVPADTTFQSREIFSVFISDTNLNHD